MRIVDLVDGVDSGGIVSSYQFPLPRSLYIRSVNVVEGRPE